MKKASIFLLLLFLSVKSINAQEYTAITGMIHVPTAEMAPEGEARIGFFFLNGKFLPDTYQYKGGKYNTTNHFIGITPFPWIELSYVCTLLKSDKYGHTGHHMKDRHLSVKARPLKEGKWWPAVAIGVQDLERKAQESYAEGKYPVNSYFQNYYMAASKHFVWKRHELGVHLAYRYYTSDFNARLRGIAGGVTYRPAFAKNIRAMVEYTGDDVNIGVDCLLWNLLFLQASLQNGKYFTGGVCLKINLLGKKGHGN